jgi:hypothetical protein
MNSLALFSYIFYALGSVCLLIASILGIIQLLK